MAARLLPPTAGTWVRLATGTVLSDRKIGRNTSIEVPSLRMRARMVTRPGDFAPMRVEERTVPRKAETTYTMGSVVRSGK